jgi:hypothetical protein
MLPRTAALKLLCFLLASASATTGFGHSPVPPAQPRGKIESPQVTLSFNTKATDTKDTVLPTGTRVRIRAEAGKYEYDFDSKTVPGQLVGELAQQVFENLQTAGWNVTWSEDMKAITIHGTFVPAQPGAPQITEPISSVGMQYSTEAQPAAPAARGAKVLVLDRDKWKPKPEKK